MMRWLDPNRTDDLPKPNNCIFSSLSQLLKSKSLLYFSTPEQLAGHAFHTLGIAQQSIKQLLYFLLEEKSVKAFLVGNIERIEESIQTSRLVTDEGSFAYYLKNIVRGLKCINQSKSILGYYCTTDTTLLTHTTTRRDVMKAALSIIQYIAHLKVLFQIKLTRENQRKSEPIKKVLSQDWLFSVFCAEGLLLEKKALAARFKNGGLLTDKNEAFTEYMSCMFLCVQHISALKCTTASNIFNNEVDHTIDHLQFAAYLQKKFALFFYRDGFDISLEDYNMRVCCAHKQFETILLSLTDQHLISVCPSMALRVARACVRTALAVSANRCTNYGDAVTHARVALDLIASLKCSCRKLPKRLEDFTGTMYNTAMRELITHYAVVKEFKIASDLAKKWVVNTLFPPSLSSFAEAIAYMADCTRQIGEKELVEACFELSNYKTTLDFKCGSMVVSKYVLPLIDTHIFFIGLINEFGGLGVECALLCQSTMAEIRSPQRFLPNLLLVYEIMRYFYDANPKYGLLIATIVPFFATGSLLHREALDFGIRTTKETQSDLHLILQFFDASIDGCVEDVVDNAWSVLNEVTNEEMRGILLSIVSGIIKTPQMAKELAGVQCKMLAKYAHFAKLGLKFGLLQGSFSEAVLGLVLVEFVYVFFSWHLPGSTRNMNELFQVYCDIIVHIEIQHKRYLSALAYAELARTRPLAEILMGKTYSEQEQYIKQFLSALEGDFLKILDYVNSGFERVIAKRETLQLLENVWDGISLAVQQKVTLVEYLLTADININSTNLHIWVLAPNQEVKHVCFPVKDTLEQDVLAMKKATLGYHVSQNKEAEKICNQYLQQMHEVLIDPIIEFLPTNIHDLVVFFPHKYLFHICWNHLMNKQGVHLVERYTTSVMSSMRVFGLLCKRQQEQQRLRLQDAAGRGGEETAVPTDSRSLVIGCQMKDVNAFDKTLSGLEFAETETNIIAALHGTTAITTDAVRAFKEKASQATKVIHITAHTTLDEYPAGSGMYGAILFPDDHNSTEATDLSGHALSNTDILTLKHGINAEIVVIASCNSGGGENSADGVIGPVRSLLVAGASAAVACVNDIPDLPVTTFLLVYMYTAISEGLSVPHALAAAQRHILQLTFEKATTMLADLKPKISNEVFIKLRKFVNSINKKSGAIFRPPFYWSSFVAYGSPNVTNTINKNVNSEIDNNINSKILQERKVSLALLEEVLANIIVSEKN